MSQLYGCGDIYTSAHDLYLFNEALYSGKLISKELRSNVYGWKKDYEYAICYRVDQKYYRFLLLATMLHLILPNSNLQKYVKFVVSLLLVVLILTPLLNYCRQM